jgi:CDP-diacylglycerol--serine O-phosphatidyltransferase
MMANGDGRRPGGAGRRYRRGVFLLPSLFTVGNLFCGYACIVYAMRNEFVTAAPFIGFAVALDILDGRIARITNTSSAFGVEFDSMADVVSFGLAPAVLAFAWGLSDLGKLGWAVGFLHVAAAALRLARFNIQSAAPSDKRYFVGMPTPAAAGVTAATVYAFPYVLSGYFQVVAMIIVLVPAVLMVSTIRFPSFKTVNLGWRRSYRPLFLFAILIVLIAIEPQITLLLLAYGYLFGAMALFAITRLRPRREEPPAASP